MKNGVIGIDLGTTYSVAAFINEYDLPEVIRNQDDNSDTTPSVVYFPEGGGDAVVGAAAKGMKDVESERVVENAKRYIGKSDAPVYEFDGKMYKPQHISALVLKKIKESAEAQGFVVKNAVITVPAYFGNEEETATKQAAEIAGLNVLDIVHEPTAATVNYCLRNYKEPRKIMVYDLGGGTFDVTVSDFRVDDDGKASIEVIRTDGNDRLGGVDFDERLFGYMCDKYAEENGIDTEDMDSELKNIIRADAESAKKDLTSLERKNYTIRYDGDRTRIELTREEFENRSRDLVDQTMNLVDKLLGDLSYTTDDIDVVLLVGGSTLMPMVKNAVEAKFPGKVKVEEPHLAVAKGAALAAAVEWNETIRKAIEKSEEEGKEEIEAPGIDGPITREQASGLMINVPEQVQVVNDKLTRSLGPAIFTEDDRYMIDNLLFVGDDTTAESEAVYGTRVENAAAIVVNVYENVAEDRADRLVTPSLDPDGNPQYTDPALKVKHIGEVTLKLPPNTPKGSPIKVIFSSGTTGLKVTAVNMQTGEEATVTITSENTLTQEEMEESKKLIDKIEIRGDI